MSSFPTSLCGVLIFCWESAALLHPPASRRLLSLSINLSLSTCLYQLVSVTISCLTISVSITLPFCQLVSITFLCINTSLYQLVRLTSAAFGDCPLDARRRGCFAWQARHLVTLCSLWSPWTPLTPRRLCVAGTALGDSL
jgi:hypothetical protein